MKRSAVKLPETFVYNSLMHRAEPRCKEYTDCGARSCSPRAVAQAGSAIFVDGNENEKSAPLTTTKNFTMNGVYF